MAKKLAKAVKRKISLAVRGKKNPFYGKKHKKSSLEKISKAVKGRKNPMYGKKHSAKTRKKISLALKRAHRNRKNRDAAINSSA